MSDRDHIDTDSRQVAEDPGSTADAPPNVTDPSPGFGVPALVPGGCSTRVAVVLVIIAVLLSLLVIGASGFPLESAWEHGIENMGPR